MTKTLKIISWLAGQLAGTVIDVVITVWQLMVAMIGGIVIFVLGLQMGLQYPAESVAFLGRTLPAEYMGELIVTIVGVMLGIWILQTVPEMVRELMKRVETRADDSLNSRVPTPTP